MKPKNKKNNVFLPPRIIYENIKTLEESLVNHLKLDK
jgi:hypothetical protein